MTLYFNVPDAPRPAGHYSQATFYDGQLFISGQLPIDPFAATPTSHNVASFREQSALAISNVIAILTSFGGDTSHLSKVTAYIVGIENWNTFDAVYSELLGDARPARSVVPVAALHFGFLVEVDAIAVGLSP